MFWYECDFQWILWGTSMSRKVNILSMSGRMFHMTSLFEYIVYEMKLRTFTSRLLPPANEVCEGYVFTGVCLSTGGACMVAGGACVVAPGGGGWHAWLLWGGVCGCSQGGMCGCSRGACMVAPGGACMVAPRGGMRGCSQGGCAWFFRWEKVNERAVRILLECILVSQWDYKLKCYFTNDYKWLFTP